MGTVATSTLATATAYGNQRKIDRAQNGVLWSFTPTAPSSGNNGFIIAYYSTDGGATWSAQSNAVTWSAAASSYTLNYSSFIDLDDYLHLVYKDPINGYIYYVRGTPNAARTAYTWSAATTVISNANYDHPDLVAHREGSGWVVHIVASSVGSTTSGKAYYWSFTVSSSGVVAVRSDFPVAAAIGTANSNSGYPSIDFNHTGDGKTVAGGTPHLYVGWSAGATGAGYGIRFRKATYSAGSWTWGTEREIDNTSWIVAGANHWLNCIFDGTRVVLGGYLRTSGGNNFVVSWDRDAADTTTTQRYVSGMTNADLLASGSMTYDPAGNLFFFGTEGTGAVLQYLKWTRSTSTASAKVVIDSTANGAPYCSTRRGPQGQAIDYVYTDGTASPYEVKSGRIALNQNPTAPTPVSPADNATWDSATDQTVTLPYADPDGNPAAKVRVYYRPKGTSAPFAVIEQNTTAASGTNVNVTIPAGTWPGDIQYYGQFADSSGAWSDPGPTRTVTGIPAGLAALTGGGGGTAFSAWTIHNATENARVARVGTRALTTTVASVSPLTITVDGGPVTAMRNAGYTPTAGDTVQAEYISGAWIVQDRVV